MLEAREPPDQPGGGTPERRAGLGLAALIALALLSGAWAWWAWREGAYFGVVQLPGTILLCLGAALLIYFAPWRINLRLSRSVAVVLVALVALAVWAALSALWSPAPDVAVADGQRIALYALAFGLGLGLCNLLGPRMMLSLVPLAFAGAFAGVATIIALAGGDTPLDLLNDDGTLDFPLGYRNANAAFFAIAIFPALGLASDRELDWRLRSLALGTATLCIDFFLLAQSRASVPAMVVGLLVYTLASPHRVRALSWLALAALPAVGITPALTSLYSAAGDAGAGLGAVTDEMHTAGLVAAATAALAILLGALAARFERRLPGLGSHTGDANRAVIGTLAALAVICAIGFVVAVGNPGQWISDRADEFRHAGSPDLSQQSSRFVINAGSNRYDTWRVALHDFAEDPIRGDGAGGYQYSYLRERDVGHQYVRDAHSVEMELLAELGIVGLGLFAVAIVAAIVGVARARRLGPSAAALAAIALATAGYWLVHASVDWFWPYPAITAPTLALLGSACAPAVRAREGRRRRPVRGVLVAGLVLLALTAVPPFLSERYVNDAYATWRTDLERAYDDLDRAQSLNRLNDLPLLAEGSIARAAGDRERALAAFREAAELRPEEWATHFLIAELLAPTDLPQAREQIRIALELNPLGDRNLALAERLGVATESDDASAEAEDG